MTRGPIGKLIEQLRRSAGRSEDEMSDAGLLQRYAVHRDEGAFEVLVQRFGPMVLGVCRRVAGDIHTAEDAFQATFLVLAKKAHSLVRKELVGNWLWGVAYRTARRAKADAARWRSRESEVRVATAPGPVEEVMWRDLRPVLDEEISRLPAKYRRPFVLCYLEGKTNDEAARKLHCPTGTVFTRLARARELLRDRLTRRGVTLASATLAAALTAEAMASVSPVLVRSTVKAAALFAAGNMAATAGINIQAATLAEGALKAMFVSKLKVTTAILLAAGTLASVGTLYGYRVLANGQEADRQDKRPPEKEPAKALQAEQKTKASKKTGGKKPKDAEDESDSLAPQDNSNNDTGGFGSGSGFGFGSGSGSGFGSGQGMGFGMGSGSGSSKLSTLSQKAVVRELALSDKQQRKLRELQNKQQRAMRRMVPQNPLEAFSDPGAVMKDMQRAPEKMKKLTKEIDAAIDEMLTEKQSKRLREISLQQQRGHALDDPEVAEALKITKEQQKQLREIQTQGMQKMQEAGLQAMGDAFRAGPNPASFQKTSAKVSKRLQEIWDDLGDQLLSILTTEQKSKWKEMTGKPFKGKNP